MAWLISGCFSFVQDVSKGRTKKMKTRSERAITNSILAELGYVGPVKDGVVVTKSEREYDMVRQAVTQAIFTK